MAIPPTTIDAEEKLNFEREGFLCRRLSCTVLVDPLEYEQCKLYGTQPTHPGFPWEALVESVFSSMGRGSSSRYGEIRNGPRRLK